MQVAAGCMCTMQTASLAIRFKVHLRERGLVGTHQRLPLGAFALRPLDLDPAALGPVHGSGSIALGQEVHCRRVSSDRKSVRRQQRGPEGALQRRSVRFIR